MANLGSDRNWSISFISGQFKEKALYNFAPRQKELCFATTNLTELNLIKHYLFLYSTVARFFKVATNDAVV